MIEDVNNNETEEEVEEDDEEEDIGRRAFEIVAAECIDFWFGRDIWTKNSNNGQTPLAEAASQGDECGVFVILHHYQSIRMNQQEEDEEVQEQNQEVFTPTSRQQRLDIVNKKGRERGWTPLHEGVAYPTICNLLVEAGARINERDYNGYTALHFAIEQEANASACMLLDYGDASLLECTDFWTERTPLTLAAIYGNYTISQKLLEKGAMVDRPSPQVHRTPLHVAAGAGHEDLVELLLQYNANVDAKDHHHGSTPLHLCVGRHDISETELPSYMKTARRLIEAGADANEETDEDSDTPLHLAARHENNQQLVDLLLEEGADPTIVNDLGYTPFDPENKALD